MYEVRRDSNRGSPIDALPWLTEQDLASEHARGRPARGCMPPSVVVYPHPAMVKELHLTALVSRCYARRTAGKGVDQGMLRVVLVEDNLLAGEVHR